MERFRESVAATDFPKVGGITISTGVTEITSDIFHVTLMDYADQALYYSKNNGRNKTTFFEEIVASGDAKEQDVEEGGVHFFD